MLTLRVGHTCRNAGCDKPYLKQDEKVSHKTALRGAHVLTMSLEGPGDRTPRGMIARFMGSYHPADDKIRLTRLPELFLLFQL